jgi:hypothetical protein
VIKRVRFATRRADLTPEAFAERWRAAVVATVTACPDAARPLRVAVCTGLPEVVADQVHDGVGLQWFRDPDHLERFESWVQTASFEAPLDGLGAVLDLDASPVILTEEAVLRGAPWLEERWKDGGEKLKHMAVARRAAHLSAAEFSERWRSRAGTVKRPGESTAVAIPDDARGQAYVQNHVLARASGDWAYDAFNEVYFEDVESLRVRVDWFNESLAGGTEDDLVRESWFLAAREEVILGGAG